MIPTLLDVTSDLNQCKPYVYFNSYKFHIITIPDVICQYFTYFTDKKKRKSFSLLCKRR